jgi:hypothetical protein
MQSFQHHGVELAMTTESHAYGGSGEAREIDQNLLKLLTAQERAALMVDFMPKEQQAALHAWGLRMFSLAEQEMGEISAIKYSGRLVVLDDGSRWEVDEIDEFTSSMWNQGDRVVVIDDRMYRLDDLESVAVEKDA